MDTSHIEDLCQNVASSVAQVRSVFRSSPAVPEILDRYWGLQDNLSRLLEALTDHPDKTAEAFDSCPGLLNDVVDVLEFSLKLETVNNIAAVREASESINDSLMEIQYLKQSRALTASA